jgi:hypothetical protein
MAGGPLSSRMSGWRLHDYLFAIFFVVLIAGVVTTTIHAVAPNSAAGVDIHNAGQAVGHALEWLASGFNLVASWFLQL